MKENGDSLVILWMAKECDFSEERTKGRNVNGCFFWVLIHLEGHFGWVLLILY